MAAGQAAISAGQTLKCVRHSRKMLRLLHAGARRARATGTRSMIHHETCLGAPRERGARQIHRHKEKSRLQPPTGASTEQQTYLTYAIKRARYVPDASPHRATTKQHIYILIYVCIYLCVYLLCIYVLHLSLYIYTYIHAYIHANIHTYMHTYRYTYTYAYAYTFTYTYT